MAFLPKRTESEQQAVTVSYMPSGRATRAMMVEGKFLYKTINAFSKVFGRIETSINTALAGLNIFNSTLFLREWEQALAIPDEQFSANTSEAERQKYAQMKLSAEGVYTKLQLEWLCSVYGAAVTVYPGHFFYLNYDPRVGTFSTEKESRFTIVFGISMVDSDSEFLNGLFPVPFPWVFGVNRYSTLQLFMREIVQANLNIRWFIDNYDTVLDSYTETEIWQDSIASTDIVQDNIL